MNKFDPNDPLVKEFLDDPRVAELKTQLSEFIAAEYAKFDNEEFVGETLGGSIRVAYCFGKKGFCKIEVNDSTYSDKTYTCDALPMAINSALIKYNNELKEVEKRITEFEKNLFVKMVDIAMDKTKAKEAPTTPGKKTYLN
jgi:hypothetical protein